MDRAAVRAEVAPVRRAVEPPGGFQPFALGLVEIPGEGRVAAVLDVDDLDSIHIGMSMRVERLPGRVPRAKDAT